MDPYLKNVLHFYKIRSSVNVRTCVKMRDVESGKEFALVFSEWKKFTRQKNSVVLVRKRTIPTERPQPAGEVSANFSW
jgi:hypothetical protein